MDSKIDALSEKQRCAIELQSFKIKMNDYLSSEISKKEIIGTGEFLKRLLTKLNIEQHQFANDLGVKPPNLSKLLKGERKISFEFSLVWEQLFGIDSNLWLSIHSKNRWIKMSKMELQAYRKYKLSDLINKQKKIVG